MAEDLPKAPAIPPHIMHAMQELMKMAQAMAKIKHKIVVMSGKGGVGKTSVSVNLAVTLAKEARVGIGDADVTGPDVPKILGVEHLRLVPGENGGMEPVTGVLDVKAASMQLALGDRDTPVIWRGPLQIKAPKQVPAVFRGGELDYLIIDLPPGTSDEPLSIAQEIPDADGAVVVTTPQDVSLLDVRKRDRKSTRLNSSH